jgi:hypothetical protein
MEFVEEGYVNLQSVADNPEMKAWNPKISRRPRSRFRSPLQRAPWSAVEELLPINLKGEHTHA